jgi:hypothetical protein
MFVKRVLPFVAALGCAAVLLGSTDAEASHGRRHRRNCCCEPVAVCVPDCCCNESRVTGEWVEWHPDCNGGHHHRYRSVVRDDCRREVVEVPMHHRPTYDVVVTNDCLCRR